MGGRLMFLAEHPLIVPMVVAFACGVIATVAVSQGAWVAGLLAYADAVGMTAIAAHSRIVQREGGR
jgi:hypothetical protein